MATSWEGSSCFTKAESIKLVEQLKSFHIDGLSGRWIHYINWKDGSNFEATTKRITSRLGVSVDQNSRYIKELLRSDETTLAEVSGTLC